MSRHPFRILPIVGILVFGAPAAGVWAAATRPALTDPGMGAAGRPLNATASAPGDSAPGDSATADSASSGWGSQDPGADSVSAAPADSGGAPDSASATGPGRVPDVEATALGMEITSFVQLEPDDGEPASEATRAYVSYDQDNLYIVFVCQDDPAQVRARVVPRDKITDDDRVVVFLDTFDDNQRAYAFEANPLGIQRDGIIAEGQDDDYTFDALWYSEGRLTSSGYVVRMRIPFTSLRFADKSVQTWGIGLGRYVERKSEKAYWPYITNRVEGFVNQLGSLNGLADISHERRFQLVPYSVLADARFLDDELDVPAFQRTMEKRFGIDAKAVVRDAMTVDVAVNPDFSQVEPDEPQVTVNQRFEVRVDEKRPFFIENAGFFQTPIELFFSRRIADPSGGARMTSKLGPWVVGGLLMNDQEPGRVPADDPLHAKQAYAGVLRVQRELPGQTTVGLFASDRELAGDFNRTYGLDTRAKLGTNWVATGQVVQAETRTPDEPRVWGSGSYFKVRRDGRHFDASAKYTQFSPEFEAQLGFVRRVGFREVGSDWEYTFRPRKSLVTSWGPSLSTTFNWAWDGRLQDAEAEVSNKIELPASTQLEAGWTQTFELFEDQEFRLHELKITGESKWFKWIGISAEYKYGTKVNHDPADTIPGVPGGLELLPFVGQSQEADMGVTLRPTPQIEFKQSLTYGSLRLVEAAPYSGMRIQPVFSNWILKSKLKYQANRELSIRAIANYEALVPNAALSDEDEERMLVPDLLITYLVNPWTAVHAGYTERFENVLLRSGEVIEEPRSSQAIRFPTTSVDRQFFVKVSYLVRM